MVTNHFPVERQCQSGTSAIGIQSVQLKRLWFLSTILLADTFCQNHCVPTVEREGRPPTRYRTTLRGQC